MNIVVAFILVLGSGALCMSLNALHAVMLLRRDGFPIRESCIVALFGLLSVAVAVFAFGVLASWQVYWYVYLAVVVMGVIAAVPFMKSASSFAFRG